MFDSREDSVRFEGSSLLHTACDAVATEFNAMGHVVDAAVFESKDCTSGSLCPRGPITMANLHVRAFKLTDACTYYMAACRSGSRAKERLSLLW